MNCAGIVVDPVVLFIGGVLLLLVGACFGAIAVALVAFDKG